MSEGPPTNPHDRATRRLLRTLIRASASAVAVLAALVVLWGGGALDGLPRAASLVRVGVRTGAAGLALGSLVLVLTGALSARVALAMREDTPRPSRGRWRPTWPWRRRRQETVVPPLALAAAACVLWLMPRAGAPSPADAMIVGGGLLALAFPALLAERTLAGIRPVAMPDAPALRALVLLATLALAAGAAVTIAIGLGFDWAAWIATALAWIVVLVAVELAARALGRGLLPALPPGRARAAADSLIAAMLAGSLARGGVAAPLRERLGLDFARNWALGFLRRAALPALLLTALLCWGLSGLSALGGAQRGVYERLGAPVAVLGPGLHLGLPWPLGRVRMLEYDVVHELAVGGAVAATEMVAAEAAPTAAADRLWDQAHPGEVTYLIASASQGGQGFQTVSADLRVLWRYGLGEADARRAAYGTRDPEALLRAAVGRRLARYFAVRGIEALLDGRREAMAETLRAQVAADLAPLESGLEVLAVVIEAVHPPAGAAAAYHGVQAAAIAARASVAAEQGRARGAANQARQEALRLTDVARAAAAESVAGARAEAVRFEADHAAHAQGGRAFLLERYLDTLATALARTPLTLIDNRLDTSTAPVLDLRPVAGAAIPPAAEDRD